MWRAKVRDKITKVVNSSCSGFSFISPFISLRNGVSRVHNFNYMIILLTRKLVDRIPACTVHGGCIPACPGQGVCIPACTGKGVCILACTGQGDVCLGDVCPGGLCIPAWNGVDTPLVDRQTRKHNLRKLRLRRLSEQFYKKHLGE